MHINETFRRSRVQIVVEEDQQVLNIMCVCVSVALAIQMTHAPYYIVICGLSGCTIFLHIVS